jgi:YesN/AraC family two-component response regulator
VFLEYGYQTVGSSTSPLKAEKEIIKKSPDVVFTDLRMPKVTGIELMERLQQKGVACEFVIISAYGEFEASRSFFTSGGFDYLTKPVWDDDLQNLLNRLSEKITGKVRVPATVVKTPSPELNEIMVYIKNNLTAKHTLESLGERFKIHHTYICDLFSNHLETTFTAYMTKLRMETAAELLKTTPKSAKEIAFMCGCDYVYFLQSFKKYYSCTPTAFREAAK